MYGHFLRRGWERGGGGAGARARGRGKRRRRGRGRGRLRRWKKRYLNFANFACEFYYNFSGLF